MVVIDDGGGREGKGGRKGGGVMMMSVRITAWMVTEDFLLPDMNLSTAHTSLNLILLIILP